MLGVIGLVKFDDGPPYWQTGDVLENLEGPFVGLRGNFPKKTGIERLSLLVDILGQCNWLMKNVNYLQQVIK